jgi:hypothetical protein
MRDTALIDQVFLHVSVQGLLEPIREFLDNWTIDEEDDNGIWLEIELMKATISLFILNSIQSYSLFAIAYIILDGVYVCKILMDLDLFGLGFGSSQRQSGSICFQTRTLMRLELGFPRYST